MPWLKRLEWCGDNIAFRNSTNRLSEKNLENIIRGNEIFVVFDVRKDPDHRIEKYLGKNACFFYRIPEGHTASICLIEDIVDHIRHYAKNNKVLIISHNGQNRAPLLAALACDNMEVTQKVLSNPRYLTIPFFRSLLEE